ncbi:hypothetical protein V1512DRAFT_272370 [Lipomyces arxii]|uniref:uncharacterized protein n=1 Tax=Lipomyces arxii TaxID=56418 RepID=UPI0034CE35C7
MGPLAFKHPRRGFKIPQAMPDGVHKRKLEKIKKNLSHNADVKRSYRKTLRKMGYEVPPPPSAVERLGGGDKSTTSVTESTEGETVANEPETGDQAYNRRRKPKVSRFNKAEGLAAAARTRKEEAQKEFERREKERKQKLELRDQQKKKMMTYTKSGQPKMGARIDILLDKIKRNEV